MVFYKTTLTLHARLQEIDIKCCFWFPRRKVGLSPNENAAFPGGKSGPGKNTKKLRIYSLIQIFFLSLRHQNDSL